MSSPAPFIFIFLIIAVVGFMLSRLMDAGRIEDHLRERGGQLLEKRWTPFGPGWYGDHNRIYSVRYVDREGNEHQAHCKTHMLSGVYWTDDQIVHHAKPPVTMQSLQNENARLKVEVEHLKSRAPAKKPRRRST